MINTNGNMPPPPFKKWKHLYLFILIEWGILLMGFYLFSEWFK